LVWILLGEGREGIRVRLTAGGEILESESRLGTVLFCLSRVEAV
jgi:hypothetical protein